MAKLLRNMAVVAVALLSLTGCFKKVTTATTLCIKVVEEVPVMIKESDVDSSTGEVTEKLKEVRKDMLPAEGCYAYLYYVDSDKWSIESYEDAAAKTLTNIESGEKISEPDAESSPHTIEGSSNNYLSLHQEGRSAFVVVVYPAAQMYAYMHRGAEAENLPTTYLTLIFHTWKTGTYNEGSKDGFKWVVVAPETTVRPPIIEEPESEVPGDSENQDVNN